MKIFETDFDMFLVSGLIRKRRLENEATKKKKQ
jgi:hypothetical protein